MPGRIILVGLLLVVAVAGFLWYGQLQREAPVSTPLPTEPERPEPVQPRHPLPAEAPDVIVEPLDSVESPEPAEPPEPLPPLDESDAYLAGLLVDRFGEEALEARLVKERIAERTVVFVNSLDGDPVSVELRPIVPVPGGPQVERINDSPYWSAGNQARYAPLVALVQSISPAEAAGLYVRHYPLLQEAHEALAPEVPYFNDRVVEVIDHLLTMPVPDERFELEPHEAIYRFADQELEAESTGRKILMRMGPDHARALRNWLREFRTEITGP